MMVIGSGCNTRFDMVQKLYRLYIPSFLFNLSDFRLPIIFEEGDVEILFKIKQKTNQTARI